jgi:hypothetical protein
VLRIPADWLTQKIRCKHCGTVLHAKHLAAAPPPAAPVGIPESARRKQKPPATATQADRREAGSPGERRAQMPTAAPDPSPFATLRDEDSEGRAARRTRRRGSGWWKGALVALGVAVIAGGILAVAWVQVVALLKKPEIAQLLEEIKPGPKEPAGNPDPVKAEEPPRPASAFPRRLLVISVHNYLFANPLPEGTPGARNVASLVEKVGDGFRVPPAQRLHLSDGAAQGQARPPLKAIIENALTGFLESSRAQDRLLVLFIGQAVEIDDAVYLAPIEGDLENAATLIPLPWFYEQLKSCKARQKVLVLDVNHVNKTRGQERPGGGAMGPKLEEAVQKPPPGVQVWASCSAGQMSYETEASAMGVFLDQLFHATAAGVQGKIQRPDEPLPLEYFRDAVNTGMKAELDPYQLAQVSRLGGQEAADGAAYDPQEAAPTVPALAGGPASTGPTARLVETILEQVDVPPVKATGDGGRLNFDWLPPFTEAALKDYRPSAAGTDEQQKLRQAVQRARVVLWAVSPASAPPKLANVVKQVKQQVKFDLSILQDGYRYQPDENQFKQKVFQDEKNVARILDRLTETLDELKGVEGMLDKEGKRWRAHYDFIRARVEMQLAYVYEYQSMLGQMRRELPPRDPKVHGGWRLASTPKLQGDSAGRKLANGARKTLDKIVKDCAGTPWELLAKRERLTALGLEWQPAK